LEQRGIETAAFYPGEAGGVSPSEKTLKEIITAFKPQLVHLHSLDHKYLPLLDLLSRAGIPLIQTLHDHRLVCLSGSLFSRKRLCRLCRGGKFYRAALEGCVNWPLAWETYFKRTLLGKNPYRAVKLFISPSVYLQKEMQSWGVKIPIKQLYNFLPPEAYQEKLNPQSRTLVFSGRLSPLKGIDILLEAVKDLPYRLKILGEGELRGEIAAKIQLPGWQGVKLSGQKSGESYRLELADSALMVLPSICPENSPMVIAEAMALGLPVLGSDLGGIPELLEQERGMVFTPGNADELRKKIVTLMENPELREKMGEKSRTFAQEHFAPDIFFRKLLEFYQSLIIKGD